MKDILTLLNWLESTEDLLKARHIAIMAKDGAQAALETMKTREKCKQCTSECEGRVNAEKLIVAAEALETALNNFHEIGTEIIVGGVVHGRKDATSSERKGTGSGENTKAD